MKSLAIITGASSGIGEATAKLLSSLGYPLLLVARRVERMEALNLPNTMCRKVDVTDREALAAAVQEAEEKFGPADLLVNNAGLMLLNKMVEQDASQWDAMFDVNVKGVLNGINSVLKGMVERKHGTIINIGSIAGRKTFPAHVGYCGTKFAVHAISENLREEMAPHNVRVSVVAPGVVETELLGHTTNEQVKDDYVKWKASMGGVLAVEHIAEAIRFAYEQPQSVCIREIDLAPTPQES